MIEGLFGSLIGGSMGMVNTGLNAALSYQNTAKTMRLQQKMARQDLEQNPSHQLQGLRNAGLNPLMALGSSTQISNASGSAPVAPGAPFENPVSAGKDQDRKDKDQDNQDKITAAQISTIKQQAEKIKLENKILRQQIKNYNDSIFRGRNSFDVVKNIANGNTTGTVKQYLDKLKQYWNKLRETIKITSGRSSIN